MEAEKRQLKSELPRKFASIPREHQEFLVHAESRLARFREMYANDAIRPAAISDIRKAVHSPSDVANEARAMENESVKYLQAMNRISAGTQKFIAAVRDGYPKAIAGHVMANINFH
jgi:hypothetical protein